MIFARRLHSEGPNPRHVSLRRNLAGWQSRSECQRTIRDFGFSPSGSPASFRHPISGRPGGRDDRAERTAGEIEPRSRVLGFQWVWEVWIRCRMFKRGKVIEIGFNLWQWTWRHFPKVHLPDQVTA